MDNATLLAVLTEACKTHPYGNVLLSDENGSWVTAADIDQDGDVILYL